MMTPMKSKDGRENEDAPVQFRSGGVLRFPRHQVVVHVTHRCFLLGVFAGLKIGRRHVRRREQHAERREEGFSPASGGLRNGRLEMQNTARRSERWRPSTVDCTPGR